MYVGNLPYDVRWQDLKDFMKQAGDVAHADVWLLPDGRSKGCGIVEFANAEDAQNAIKTLHNIEWKGRPLLVREDREEAPPMHSGAPGAQLFVTNIPYSADWRDLKDLFKEVGPVVRADIHMSGGRSRGTGVVLFENAGDAKAAIDQLNGYNWNGLYLEVREDRFAGGRGAAAPRAPFASRFEEDTGSEFTKGTRGNGQPSETIYVDNLPWSTTNQDLLDLFGTIGTVEQAEIKYLRNGKSAGSAVVKFAETQSADDAVGRLNKYNYGNRDLSVSYVSHVN